MKSFISHSSFHFRKRTTTSLVQWLISVSRRKVGKQSAGVGPTDPSTDFETSRLICFTSWSAERIPADRRPPFLYYLWEVWCQLFYIITSITTRAFPADGLNVRPHLSAHQTFESISSPIFAESRCCGCICKRKTRKDCWAQTCCIARQKESEDKSFRRQCVTTTCHQGQDVCQTFWQSNLFFFLTDVTLVLWKHGPVSLSIKTWQWWIRHWGGIKQKWGESQGHSLN